jgi:hypothetical protein
MSEIGWWWLSFCDGSRPPGSQFLGVCIVDAPAPSPDDEGRAALATAIVRAHALGINPGGEVQASWLCPLSEPRLQREWTHRLLSRAECEAFDAAHALN